MLPRRPKLTPTLSLDQIKQSHARLILSGDSSDASLVGRLLLVLALTPSSPPAHYPLSIFQSMPRPSAFAANNLIRCLARSESPVESVSLYASILRDRVNVMPNEHTFTFLLHACGKARALGEGMQVHAHAVKLGWCGDVFIRNALVHFYCTCDSTESAYRLFDEVGQSRDVVTWNAMITGLWRDGRLDVAEKMFAEMPEKDVVSWTAMITGYVQNGKLEEGLECFRKMAESDLLRPNEAILVTALSASAQLGLLEQGRSVHSTIDSLSFPITVPLGTALVDMYAKCGSIERSKYVFEQMRKRNVWTWNAMICGLAAHGLGQEALALFETFLEEGLKPTSVTFVGVLSACSRSRLLDEGRRCYKLMMEKYGFEPEMEHYGCMVDLLSRAGHIYEAVELIESMKVPADPVMWATLLGACKVHGLAELGEEIGSKLINLDPVHDGHYVQLSNIYAKAMKWTDVVRVRGLMIERKASKNAGWSLLEAGGKVHRFVAGDRRHERRLEIYEMLDSIERRIAEAGYRPDTSSVLHDIGEEEKENAVREHSERLAIAFALMVTRPGERIRVVKNLRVCADCHEVTKMISKAFGREIVVRDGSRFHHFKEGKCSCLDYW